MRVILIGAGTLAVTTAELLSRRGHDVVMIERDRERIEALSQRVDCGFVHGDGTRPAILREADAANAQVLAGLTGDDQTNILASLVGRSLGAARVITRIGDAELEHICLELGLTDVIVPSRAIALALGGMIEGGTSLEISSLLKGDLRLLSFVVGEEEAGPLAGLRLPERTRVTWIYRGDEFVLPAPETELATGDEVVLVTEDRRLDELCDRFRVRRP